MLHVACVAGDILVSGASTFLAAEPPREKGHLTSIFGKYLFGRRFEIQNFQNICCKISYLPTSAGRDFRKSKKWYNCPFLTDSYPKKVTQSEILGAFSLAEIFEKVSFDPYNIRITRL